MSVIDNNPDMRKYEPPKVAIFCVVTGNILVASNEGLGYEDLFSTSESVLYEEEPFTFLF